MFFPYSFFTSSQTPHFLVPPGGDPNNQGGTIDLTNLVVYYSFDSSPLGKDLVGGHTLTINGSPTNPAGLITSCLGLIAGFNYLNSGSTSAFQANSSGFTIAFWVKFTASGASNYIIKKAAGANFEYGISRSTGNGISFFLYDTLGSSHLFSSADSIANNQWAFVIVWYDGTAQTSNIQINNGSPSSVSYTTTPVIGNNTFVIGEDTGFGNLNDMFVDEVSIWKRVLNTEEKTLLYNNGLGRTYSF